MAGGGPCCPQDCPVPQLVCTVTAAGVCSGGGVCAPTIGGGVCLCHPGYAGGSCDLCAGGFTSVGGACSAAAAIPVVVPFVCTTTYGFPNRMRCVQWWWWLILAAVALLLLLLLCIACRCCCFRKKKQPKRASQACTTARMVAERLVFKDDSEDEASAHARRRKTWSGETDF